MLFLVNRAGVPSVAKWVHLTGGKTPSHDPAFIKELIDMRMTGREKPVPGTLGMDRERHAPTNVNEHEGSTVPNKKGSDAKRGVRKRR
jgi:hypothetical protein